MIEPHRSGLARLRHHKILFPYFEHERIREMKNLAHDYSHKLPLTKIATFRETDLTFTSLSIKQLKEQKPAFPVTNQERIRDEISFGRGDTLRRHARIRTA
jgi:hypothetical protein